MSAETEVFDAFEQHLHQQLVSLAELMPTPTDGLVLINARAAHRRRTRHVTWALVAAAVVVILGVAGVALRSSSSDSAPYVDTTATTDPDLPATIPADPLPAIAPAGGSAYDWRFASWGGPSAYMLVINPTGTSTGTLLLRMQSAPWSSTSTETALGPQGQVITVDRSGTNQVDLSWQIAPGVTASVGVGSFPAGSVDPVQQGLALIATLESVDLPRWQSEVRSFFEPAGVLIADPTVTALTEASDPVGRGNATAETVNLWTPGVGWGQVTLDQRDGISIPPVGTPVMIRGVQGTLVDYGAPSDGRRIRLIQWIADGRTYTLTFGAQISVDQAVATANQLHLIEPAETDQLLFPTWEPDGATGMQLLQPDTSTSENGP